MCEPCGGPGSGSGSGAGAGAGAGSGAGPRPGRRGVPRFVLGCEDVEQDAGHAEAGMKSDMFREEDMEDDEDELVSLIINPA